jgi:hypothetical protein
MRNVPFRVRPLGPFSRHTAYTVQLAAVQQRNAYGINFVRRVWASGRGHPIGPRQRGGGAAHVRYSDDAMIYDERSITSIDADRFRSNAAGPPPRRQMHSSDDDMVQLIDPDSTRTAAISNAHRP